MEIKPGQTWTNIKHGNDYKVLFIAQDVSNTDTTFKVVAYENEKGEKYIRDVDNFREKFKPAEQKDISIMASCRSAVAKENGYNDFTELMKSATDEKEAQAFENEAARKYAVITDKDEFLSLETILDKEAQVDGYPDFEELCMSKSPNWAKSVENRALKKFNAQTPVAQFDITKIYETVGGDEVKLGFIDKDIIRGYAYVDNKWHNFGWLVSTLQACKEGGELYAYSDLYALREKKTRLQISHTVYISTDGSCWDRWEEDLKGPFAVLTINAEVEEGSNRVVKI